MIKNTPILRTMLAIAMLPVMIIACKKDVSVTGITLSQNTASLIIDETLTLTATVLPENASNKDVTWWSTNTAVATVANGEIIAKDFGLTNIIVTTRDGNKTDTCVVTVGLGTVSFATDSIWTVGSQTWSDAVQTSGCSNRTTFYGGDWLTLSNFNVDCRSNPGQKGDLFSWQAVYELKDELCPSPWRVPTTEDFRDLDIALGGTGNSTNNNPTHRDRYLNDWGGTYGGESTAVGTLNHQGSIGFYWSQSEVSDDSHNAYLLFFGRDTFLSVAPAIYYGKFIGFSLRCVRDN